MRKRGRFAADELSAFASWAQRMGGTGAVGPGQGPGRRAIVVELGDGVRLRVAAVPDLVHLKLLAAEEPKRHASKRTHDIADAVALSRGASAARTSEVLQRLQMLGAPLSVLKQAVPDKNER